jgi:tRNA A37 threonylcarbamoyladenosine dehydratase
MSVKEEEIRSAMLLGESGLDALHRAHVAVFGIGGVGGYVCEALARAGVGELTLIDNDTVSLSNINRQIIALHSTVGRQKTEVMQERIRDINPDCTVHTLNLFYLPETADSLPLNGFSYIVDAIDTVSGKIELAVRAKEQNIPLICAMGTGNKLSPLGFTVTDLSKTSGCPLARVMRRELRARGIQHLKVVYSEEPAAGLDANICQDLDSKKLPPASLSYVPGVAGLILAGEVIRDLCQMK